MSDQGPEVTEEQIRRLRENLKTLLHYDDEDVQMNAQGCLNIINEIEDPDLRVN